LRKRSAPRARDERPRTGRPGVNRLHPQFSGQRWQDPRGAAQMQAARAGARNAQDSEKNNNELYKLSAIFGKI